MKKKWIIPAIIAVVLVAIALFIASYPILLFVAATDESIKQLNNSYINSDYQGWNEVTFFDKHHFSLPDTWRIEAIDDTTYCIYGDDAQVIAYVGKLGRYAGMDSFCNETIGTAEVLTQSELFVGVHFDNGCYMYQMTAMMPDTQQEEFAYAIADATVAPDDCIILFRNDGLSREAVSEYVAAIAYSYELDSDYVIRE